MRSSVDAGSPSWAVRSESPGSVARTAARGSSLLRGRPNRAKRGYVQCAQDRCVAREPGAGSGDPQCVTQPAQLVDQADAQCVGPGPHPAPGDGLDLLHRPPAALRDLGDEVGVDRVQRGVQRRALVVGEPLPRRVHEGPRTVGDGASGQPQSVHQVADDDLPAEDPDRAGEGGGQRHDRRRPGRRCSSRPMRRPRPSTRSTGLPASRTWQTSRQIVSEATAEPPGESMCRTTARVFSSLGSGPQRGADRVAAHLPTHRAATRASGRDRAVHLDEGDVPLAARGHVRTAGRGPPIGEQQLGVRAHA